MKSGSAATLARKSRLKDIAIVESNQANAAFLLSTCESFDDYRSRVEGLIGVVSDEMYEKVSNRFKNFINRLRKEEGDARKRGGQKSEEFYRRMYTCESVFGDNTPRFAFHSSPHIPALRSVDEEVAKLISKGLSNFSKCCISLPARPRAPVSRLLTSSLSRSRVLNDAKRKSICELRARIRLLRFELASEKRQRTFPFRRNCSSDRAELDRMRRELEEKDNENRLLRERIDELLSQKRVVTKEKGKFTTEFHHLIIRLIALGIPDSKVNQVMHEVTAFVKCSLSDFPALSTIRNDAVALLGITLQQAKEVIEEVSGGNDLTLISDETTKGKHKMQTYLVNLERDENGSKVFCLGIPEVHAKTASESVEALKGRVNRIELVTSGTASGESLRKLVSSISSCMSDRASTQVLFNKLLEDFKREIMPTIRDDWDKLKPSERDALSGVHSLYCQLHIAASITDVFMRVMGEMEGLSGDDCSLLFVLRTFASHFSDRGSGKFMQVGKWVVFLDGKGVDKTHCILPSFDGQRFCIAFAIAARIFYLRDYLVEYISRFCSDNETLCKARDALITPLISSQLKTASLVDSFVSAPLIRLSEHTKHVCETSTYISEMIKYLSICEVDPARMHTLAPPSITVGAQVALFNVDSPYLKSTVSSSFTSEDSKCISSACSEIKLFLETQYADFLPGGCYHSPSQSLLDSLRNAPSTSRAAERVFGMVDWLFVKSPNCRMVRREGIVLNKMNGTMTWLENMPLDVQAKVLQSALGMRKKLVDASEEEKVELARKIREDMLEKEEEAKKKQQRAFERQSAIATVIATETGYWRTVEAMDLALEDMRNKGDKIRALTFQIQYRKSTLKQPPPRPGIFVIRPKGIPVTVERLRDTVKELIEADLTASSGKRTAPKWNGRRVERVVRTMNGMYTMVEGLIEEIKEIDGVLFVQFGYEDGKKDTMLLEEFEEELESENAKFLGVPSLAKIDSIAFIIDKEWKFHRLSNENAVIPREILPDPEAEAIPTTRNESVADIERRWLDAGINRTELRPASQIPSRRQSSPGLNDSRDSRNSRDREMKEVEKEKYKLDKIRKEIEKKEENLKKKEKELSKKEENERIEERYQRKKRMERDRQFRDEEELLRKRRRQMEQREKEADLMTQSLQRSKSMVRRERDECTRNLSCWKEELIRIRTENEELTRKNIALQEVIEKLRSEVDECRTKVSSLSTAPSHPSNTEKKKQNKKKNNNKLKEKRLDDRLAAVRQDDDCGDSIRSDVATLPSSDDTATNPEPVTKQEDMMKKEEVVSRGVQKSSIIPLIFLSVLLSLFISTVGLSIVGEKLLITQSMEELE